MRTPETHILRPRLRSFVRVATAIATGVTILLLPLVATAQEDDPMAAFLAYMGIDENKLASLDANPILVEISVADRSRQVAFAGLIRVPEDGAKLFFGSAPGAPPMIIEPEASGYFSNPAALKNLAPLELGEDDYEVLAECKPANCRFKLDAQGIQEARSIDWKAADAHRRFLDIFQGFLLQVVSQYRKQGMEGLPTYADKTQPFPVARGITLLAGEADPLLRLYPTIQKALTSAPPVASPASPASPASDRILWSISDFGYRPTLSVDRVIVRRGPDNKNLGGIIALENLYSNHYLAGRLQIGGALRRVSASGASTNYFWILDQILFDDKLGGIKRNLLSRGLKSNLSDRLKAIRQEGLALKSTASPTKEP